MLHPSTSSGSKKFLTEPVEADGRRSMPFVNSVDIWPDLPLPTPSPFSSKKGREEIYFPSKGHRRAYLMYNPTL
jgi:hypothetical protein